MLTAKPESGNCLSLAIRYAGLFSRATAIALVSGLIAGPARADAPAVEPGEEMPGGAATSRAGANGPAAFSHPSANMSLEGQLDFRIGNAMFRKIWLPAPSPEPVSDGLGPLFNARSCEGCHLKDGRGRPPIPGQPDDKATSMLLKLSVPPQTGEHRKLLGYGRVSAIPAPVYGGQLQDRAIKGHKAEGRMRISYKEMPVTLAGGEIVRLRKPTYAIADLGYGPMHPEVMLSPRIAPQMIGLGLLEAIPQEAILALADPEDENADGISGRPNLAWPTASKDLTLGRFGWKAGAASVLDQSAAAFANDIGISSWLARAPSGDCTATQLLCLQAPNGNSERGEEISRKLLESVAHYSRNLAVPKRRDAAARHVLAGKAIFSAIGCAGCHTPTFMTGKHDRDPHLSHQKIWPYTDLLLHDMGEGLADNRPEARADGREWRTAPLWGIGLTGQVSGHAFFLHDGRARSITEAILWHGGEARGSRDAFAAMARKDRLRLVAFVTSL